MYSQSLQTPSQLPGSHVPDEELVDLVLKGDRSAFEAIMRRYNQRLYRIARSYVPDDDEVEDILQESYVKAYNQIRQFENRSRFSTWLTRIVINESLMRLRHRKRSATVAINETDAGMSEFQRETAVRDTPMKRLMNNELRQILERAVDDLPEKYSSVFLMREVEGMSVAETSECLSITQTNVKVRLNRAKEMLRETISGFYQESDIFTFDLIRCDRIVQGVLHRIGRTV